MLSIVLWFAPYVSCFAAGAIVGVAGVKSWIASVEARMPATVAEMKSMAKNDISKL